MKIDMECPLCLLERGCAQIQKSASETLISLELLSKLIDLINDNLGSNAVPAYVGTMRDRLIKKITGISDPYLDEKKRSNEFALKILPKIMDSVNKENEGYERFKAACAMAVAGNILDFNVKGHSFDLDNALEFFNDLSLDLDQAKEFYNLLKRSSKVLFLADNAGEIAFDTLLVREIKRLGSEITVVVKGMPVLNDAMATDACTVGMNKIADEVIDNGTDTIGTVLWESSQEFRDRFLYSDLIVAKGMGHYETLTEINVKKPVVHLLMAKCKPVAKSIGVKKGHRCAFVRFSSE